MKKINVNSARKFYDAGKLIIIVPKKVSPTSKFFARGYQKTDNPEDSFDKLCAAISYYNCNSELGKTLTYYLPENGT